MKKNLIIVIVALLSFFVLYKRNSENKKVNNKNTLKKEDTMRQKVNYKSKKSRIKKKIIKKKLPNKKLPTYKIVRDAFRNKKSDFQLQGKGEVVHILPDDREGIRHQKFIINIGNDTTLLVVHNIDIAPRIKNIKKGDIIEFYGEYEWSEKGGLIHWTHKDLHGKHEHGYIKHKGQIYN